VRTVADRHGHARATMNLDRYAHVLPEHDGVAAGILGEALGQATIRPKVSGNDRIGGVASSS
jgi:hypothetical protein